MNPNMTLKQRHDVHTHGLLIKAIMRLATSITYYLKLLLCQPLLKICNFSVVYQSAAILYLTIYILKQK